MKTPLFFWFAICLICVFSSCEKGKCYYYSEMPCGKVYGHVKKLTDTLYCITDGEMMHPSQMNEYHFDSLNRLVEISSCLYRIEKCESDNEVVVSINHRQVIKYRYDREGRKVESGTKNYTYESNIVKTDCISGRLASLDGNDEKWEMNITNPDGGTLTAEMFCYYKEDRILVDMIGGDAGEKEHTVRVFDDKKNLIEIRRVNEKNETFWTRYTYDENRQLIETQRNLPHSDEVRKTYFEMDEFDNEGNWLKRTGFDENKEILHTTRRRIEYRM